MCHYRVAIPTIQEAWQASYLRDLKTQINVCAMKNSYVPANVADL